jgi:Rieske Fe-S protein
MIEAWVILEIDGARAQAQPVARMAAPVGGGSNGAPAVAVKAPAAETPDMSEDALLESVAIDVDDAEFQRKALNHPQIKGTPLFDLILSSGAGVLSSLVKSGALKKDDEGIWRKGGQ